MAPTTERKGMWARMQWDAHVTELARDDIEALSIGATNDTHHNPQTHGRASLFEWIQIPEWLWHEPVVYETQHVRDDGSESTVVLKGVSMFEGSVIPAARVLSNHRTIRDISSATSCERTSQSP
ncbi:hypothetical protein FPHYL_525 [Fusarium phyllophilum]|uniref:Uncharacterized protein n=1 Tax=Fusarium phyllophilum TaxID=47803 RepID=A0A8H5KBN7_9HYPO|nr:hypothetical protein FPHYL_525 [Fusarium phyllophilum]